MNGVGATALPLALALVAYPSSPRRRLAPPGIRSRRRAALSPREVGLLTALLGVLAAILLPLTALLALAVAVATAALRYRRRLRLRRAADEGRALEEPWTCWWVSCAWGPPGAGVFGRRR